MNLISTVVLKQKKAKKLMDEFADYQPKSHQTQCFLKGRIADWWQPPNVKVA